MSENVTESTVENAVQVRGLGKVYRLFDRPSDRLVELASFGRKQRARESWAVKTERPQSFVIPSSETFDLASLIGEGLIPTRPEGDAQPEAPTAGEAEVEACAVNSASGEEAGV
tara:strand:- start:1264 stop:1605 length:342 start_codon:yes stop_codon:yes gene_type:complete